MTISELKIKIQSDFLTGTSLQTIVEQVYEFTHFPVLLTTINLDILAMAGTNNVEDDLWNSTCNGDIRVRFDVADFIHSLGIDLQVNQAFEPILITNEHLSHRWVCCAVQWNTTVLGYVISLEYESVYTDDCKEIIKALSQITAYHLMSRADLSMPQETETELTLADLVLGNSVNQRRIKQCLFSPKASNTFVVLVIESQNGGSYLPSYLKDMLGYLLPESHTVIRKRKLIVLLRISSAEVPHWCKLKELMEKQGLICGISKEFKDLSDAAIYYGQALQALALGRRYFSERLYFFENLALLQVIETASGTGNISKFVCKELELLLFFDDEHETTWTKTALAYIKAGCDINKASNYLHIHRNTMCYRLEKIQSIMMVSEFDFSLILRLAFSFVLLFWQNGSTFCGRYDIPEVWIQELLT